MIFMTCAVLKATKVKLKFAAWPNTSWRPPGTDRLSFRWPEWTLARVFAEDDYTIVLVLLLFIIVISKYYRADPSLRELNVAVLSWTRERRGVKLDDKQW